MKKYSIEEVVEILKMKNKRKFRGFLGAKEDFNYKLCSKWDAIYVYFINEVGSMERKIYQKWLFNELIIKFKDSEFEEIL